MALASRHRSPATHVNTCNFPQDLGYDRDTHSVDDAAINTKIMRSLVNARRYYFVLLAFIIKMLKRPVGSAYA